MSEPTREPKTVASDDLAIEEVDLLLTEGRENGCLTTGRIAEVLQDIEVSVDQMEAIHMLFADLGIEIVEMDDVAAVDGGEPEAEPRKSTC